MYHEPEFTVKLLVDTSPLSVTGFYFIKGEDRNNFLNVTSGCLFYSVAKCNRGLDVCPVDIGNLRWLKDFTLVTTDRLTKVRSVLFGGFGIDSVFDTITIRARNQVERFGWVDTLIRIRYLYGAVSTLLIKTIPLTPHIVTDILANDSLDLSDTCVDYLTDIGVRIDGGLTPVKYASLSNSSTTIGLSKDIITFTLTATLDFTITNQEVTEVG